MPMFEDSIFNPARAVQRVGDWFEMRKAYRLANLLSLRKREGLPGPVDADGSPLETRLDDLGNARYYRLDGAEVSRVLFAGAGRDGKPGAFAIGTRKGAPLKDAFKHWPKGPGTSEDIPWEERPLHLQREARLKALAEFEILDVAEDGRKLADELRDLDRDAGAVEAAGKVSHGAEGEQAPGLVLDGVGDEEVDQRLQEYLKRGK